MRSCGCDAELAVGVLADLQALALGEPRNLSEAEEGADPVLREAEDVRLSGLDARVCVGSRPKPFIRTDGDPRAIAQLGQELDRVLAHRLLDEVDLELFQRAQHPRRLWE